ncbi:MULTISPECIES: Ig-like domain-containing protein, partial [unclassified Paraburkholderia]|uniref:Ig-like domain-containing protein n=1 Tax=unclassified Paraburkholderia TaxID=2615204 RepID=UPI0021A2F4B4
LGEGEHEFTVVERDPAGNESKPSDPHVVIVDTVAPTAEASITYMGKDSGIDNSDFLTNDGSAGRLIMGELTTELAANERVQVSVDGGKTWQDALVEDNGNWVFQDNTAHDASWTIQTRVVDTAGNIGKVVSQNVTLDTIAPSSILGVSYDMVAGLSVTLSPSAMAGDTLLVAVGDVRFHFYLTSSDIARGSASVEIPSGAIAAIQSGAAYGVAVMDAAGNSSNYIVGESGTSIETEQLHVVNPGTLLSSGGEPFDTYVGTDANTVFTVDDVNEVMDAGYIFGNGGLDTLKLAGAGQTLDLGKVSLVVSSIEVFDITGTGNNTLKLSLGDVLEQGGKDLFIA